MGCRHDSSQRAATHGRPKRAAGDRDLASSVKKLRKPSTGAWMANMLVRQQKAEIDRLIGLGEDLRSAQSLKGEAIRDASKQKVDSVGRLMRHAKAVADRTNQPVSQAVLQDLEGTLDAAFSDPESAAALRVGHLSTTLRYSGLGFGGGPAAIRLPCGRWRHAATEQVHGDRPESTRAGEQ